MHLPVQPELCRSLRKEISVICQIRRQLMRGKISKRFRYETIAYLSADSRKDTSTRELFNNWDDRRSAIGDIPRKIPTCHFYRSVIIGRLSVIDRRFRRDGFATLNFHCCAIGGPQPRSPLQMLQIVAAQFIESRTTLPRELSAIERTSERANRVFFKNSYSGADKASR